MEAISIGWEAMATSWYNKCNPIWAVEEYRNNIMGMLRWIIPDCLLFTRKYCQQFLKPGDMNVIMTTLSIFEMLMNEAIEETPEENAKFMTSWFQAAISYAVVWGFSGNMNTESRIKFDEFYREVNNIAHIMLLSVLIYFMMCVLLRLYALIPCHNMIYC